MRRSIRYTLLQGDKLQRLKSRLSLRNTAIYEREHNNPDDRRLNWIRESEVVDEKL